MGDPQLVSVGPFPSGVDNVSDEYSLREGAARALHNVDVTNAGALKRRRGYEKVLPLNDPHSLWSGAGMLLCCADGAIGRIDAGDRTFTPLVMVDRLREVSFCEAQGRVYWSNGRERGTIVNGNAGPWGMESPNGPAVAPLSVGAAMPAGRYLVALTYEAEDGAESGSGMPAAAVLGEAGGLRLFNLPARADLAINVYLTKPNGTEPLYVVQVPAGQREVEITNPRYGMDLETYQLQAPPAGHLVRWYNGRLYIASGNTLSWTVPYALHLSHPARNSQTFGGRISVLEPTTDGLWLVAGSKTLFLLGADIDEIRQIEVSDDAAAEGSALQVSAKQFPGIDYAGMAPVWMSGKGLVMGLPGGQLVPLTEGRYAVDAYHAGASLALEQRGMRQLLVALRGKTSASSLGAADIATARVKRNGVYL